LKQKKQVEIIQPQILNQTPCIEHLVENNNINNNNDSLELDEDKLKNIINEQIKDYYNNSNKNNNILNNNNNNNNTSWNQIFMTMLLPTLPIISKAIYTTIQNYNHSKNDIQVITPELLQQLQKQKNPLDYFKE
jgi:hypothetical protein